MADDRLSGDGCRPPWLLQFVREHQVKGVVARLILIDPDFPHGQSTPEWEMTASEGAMFYYGSEFAAVERFRHTELAIEAIVLRCACMSYGRLRYKGMLDFLHAGRTNQAEDFCTLGDGKLFMRFTARMEAAGGLVHRGSSVAESIELVDSRINATWGTIARGSR